MKVPDLIVLLNVAVGLYLCLLAGSFAKKDYAAASSLDATFKFIDEFVKECSVIQLENITSRLEAFQRSVKMSKFCQTHQLIGSSLFIAFDRRDNCEKSGLWLIDLFQATEVVTAADGGGGCQPKSIVEVNDCNGRPVDVEIGAGNSGEESNNDDVIEGAAMLVQLFETALTERKSRTKIIAV